jgi:hypothetical protein
MGGSLHGASRLGWIANPVRPGNLDERNLMLKSAALLLALTTAALFAGTAGAGIWKPGTPTLVSEQDAQKSLEQSFDHVFCMGVPRFGHSGEWPDETFRVLDCSIEYNEKYCPGVRYEASKGAKRFYFRLKVVRIGSCY